MVKMKVKDPNESKDMTQKTGIGGKSKRDNSAENVGGTGSPGTSLVLRSSIRLQGKATADKMIDEGKGKRKCASEDRNVEKAKSPQKKRNTGTDTLTKKKVEDQKKSKGVASKRGRDVKSKKGDSVENDVEGIDSAGTGKNLRSSNRLKGKASTDKKADEKGKGKRKQAPKDRNLELIKSPQKRRKMEETPTKKNVDDPKKSEGMASKKGSYGKSKRGDSAENGEEKPYAARTNKVTRSSNRLKGKANTDEQDKREETTRSSNIDAEMNKRSRKRTKKKVENPKMSEDVAPKKVSRGKSKRDDSDENDKETTDSAGTSKVSRSSNRLKGKANANKMSDENDKGKRKQASKNRAVETDKTPQRETKKRSDLASTNKVLRSSNRTKGNINADENEIGKKKHASTDRNSEDAGSSRKRRNDDNEIEKKKLSKKVLDIGKKKGGQAKVEKRKMPDRTCRSSSKTKYGDGKVLNAHT